MIEKIMFANEYRVKKINYLQISRNTTHATTLLVYNMLPIPYKTELATNYLVLGETNAGKHFPTLYQVNRNVNWTSVIIYNIYAPFVL